VSSRGGGLHNELGVARLRKVRVRICWDGGGLRNQGDKERIGLPRTDPIGGGVHSKVPGKGWAYRRGIQSQGIKPQVSQGMDLEKMQLKKSFPPASQRRSQAAKGVGSGEHLVSSCKKLVSPKDLKARCQKIVRNRPWTPTKECWLGENRWGLYPSKPKFRSSSLFLGTVVGTGTVGHYWAKTSLWGVAGVLGMGVFWIRGE